jgi:hypothetical protein
VRDNIIYFVISVLARRSASARRRANGNSEHTKNIWIPAGVYPDENRGRNDIFGGGLQSEIRILSEPEGSPSGAEAPLSEP